MTVPYLQITVTLL